MFDQYFLTAICFKPLQTSSIQESDLEPTKGLEVSYIKDIRLNFTLKLSPLIYRSWSHLFLKYSGFDDSRATYDEFLLSKLSATKWIYDRGFHVKIHKFRYEKKTIT